MTNPPIYGILNQGISICGGAFLEFITTDQRIAVENFYIGKIYTIIFKDSTSITRACIGTGADYVMFQEQAPKMLFTLNMQTASTIDSIELGGGGSGTTDYNDLDNKPQINGVTLSGNKSSSDLGLQDAISAEDPLPASYISGLATVATTGAYSDLSGLPTLGTAAAAAATDFATASQGSKADAAVTAISTAATGFTSLDARMDSMDTAISGKQAALSAAQLDAVNSGITAAGVTQIETNKTNISSIQTWESYDCLETNSYIDESQSYITVKINRGIRRVAIYIHIQFDANFNGTGSVIGKINGIPNYSAIMPPISLYHYQMSSAVNIALYIKSSNGDIAMSVISGTMASGGTVEELIEYTY